MNARNLILAPLLVMILLTFLVGGTRTANNINKLVILNNIQWGLRKIQRDLPIDPQQAETTWHELQREVVVLSRLNQNEPSAMQEPLSVPLQTLLQTPHPTPANIQALLQSDFFSLSLEQVDQLKNLQQEAERVTRLVTLSMLILGLVLTLVTVYEVDRLFQRLTRSRDLHIKLQEEERRRIAQDLHDGVVQELIDLKRHYSPEKMNAVIDNLRRVCHNLKPQLLEDLGLAAALEFLADELRQSGIANVLVTLDEEGLSQLPKGYELPLFRVVQELCSNIKHHAQATQVRITVAYNPSEGTTLSGTISDNGKGFDPRKSTGKGMGLTGVRERIQQVGGKLNIQSQPGQGSKFHFVIPIKQDTPSNALTA
jgi:signal transduction histidine kinase